MQGIAIVEQEFNRPVHRVIVESWQAQHLATINVNLGRVIVLLRYRFQV